MAVNHKENKIGSGGPVETKGIPWQLRYLYYAFIFSIPFEIVDILADFTVSKMVGYVFFAVALLHFHECFRRPPRAFWCFAIYLFLYALSASFQESVLPSYIQQESTLSTLFTHSQLLVLFLICYNLMKSGKVMKGTILTLAVSTTFLAVLQLLGVTSTMVSHGRVSALGDDPNRTGGVLSLGLVALIGLAYVRNQVDRRLRLLCWLCGGIVAIGVAITGSRGAVSALGLGMLAFSLTGKSIEAKVKTGAVVLAVIGALIAVSYESEITRKRWDDTFNKGDLSERGDIALEAWRMFTEKPLFGWGPMVNLYELANKTGSPRLRVDTHNTFLWILTELGLLGAAPFFGGLWLCWNAAWMARRGVEREAPLAMISCLFVLSLSVTWHPRKIFWIILAYVLASGHHRLRRPTPIARVASRSNQGRLNRLRRIRLRRGMRQARAGNQPTKDHQSIPSPENANNKYCRNANG